MSINDERSRTTYKKSGVNIEAGEEAVSLAQSAIKETYKHARGRVLSNSKWFCYAEEHLNGEILGVAVDGGGTKVVLAALLDRHGTIGIDVEAMCFNDLGVMGITPHIFLDYIAMGKQVPGRTAQIIKGMTKGCHYARVVLGGGEMAEMPALYQQNSYDIAGCAIGFAHLKESLVTGENIESGMNVYGFPSSGVHANGFSLIWKIFDIDFTKPEEAKEKLLRFYPELGINGTTLGDELLQPTIIYTRIIKHLCLHYDIAGMAHITGGGLVENPPRILPDGCGMEIRLSSWKVHPIFQMIHEIGNVSNEEMRRTFNLGIGLLVVSPENLLLNENCFLIGKIIESNEKKVFFV